MKKILMMLIAVLALSAFDAKAQGDLKFAHVKSDSVLTNIESYKAIIKEQEKIEADYQKRGEKIQRDMMKLEQELDSMQRDENTTELDIQLLAGDYQKKQQDLQMIEYTRQEQLQILGGRMEKLMKLYRKAVGVIAAKMGVTYVFDESQQVLYVGPKSTDITEKVKVEMVKMDNENPVHRFP